MGTRIRAAPSYPGEIIDRKHSLLIQYGYLVFYAMFILVFTTGLTLAFEDVKWLDPLHQSAKKNHGIV